jgi:hypothetical protein
MNGCENVFQVKGIGNAEKWNCCFKMFI